jgi:hypothetical protein
VLATGIQMLPFSHEWLGFSRYALLGSDNRPVSLLPQNERQTAADLLANLDLSTVHYSRQNLWFNPDGFAVNLASYLSDNALAGESKLQQVHPALLDENHWARFALFGQNTTVARKVDAIQIETAKFPGQQGEVQACWELPDNALLSLVKGTEQNKYKLEPGKEKAPSGYRLIAVRAKLSSDANDDGTQYRFTTNQVQLFMKGKGGRTAGYGLVGVNVPPEMTPEVSSKDRYYRLNEGEQVARGNNRFTFVFQVPDDSDLTPWYIVFRRNARAEITGAVQPKPPVKAAFAGSGKTGGKPDKNATESPDTGGDNSNGGSTGKPKPNMHTGVDPSEEARGGGRTRRYTTDEEGSSFGNQMPLEPTEYNAVSFEVHGDKIVGGDGYLTCKLDKSDNPIKGDKPALKIFDVPADKRLLQLSVRRTHPGSTFGQALDFARQLGNVSVKDDRGKEYPAVGTWGVATVGRDRIFELVYFDETSRIGLSKPPKLDIIRAGSMNTNYALYYLFHIPPGTKIVRFMTPKSDGEDLTGQNLVAPK